ncbi:MAG: two-component regulator propeller domain-containing protein [Candidatus Cryptobacteroides sp.]|nr:two-component regulator propeller domain-containing protein [Candidatus Cryptobacteroides sp.]
MTCLALIVSLLLAAPDRHVQSDWASLRFVNYSAADGLPSNTVYAVTQDAEGALWIGTRNGLARFDGVRFQSWKEYGRVNALTVDKAGRLWVGSMQGLRVRDSSTPLRSAQKDKRSSA